uniref:Uncharacterized protein n=1 Tax=Ditylenchus dipsaci TaxID=166011 RepID=A0A915DNB0_9BILA
MLSTVLEQLSVAVKPMRITSSNHHPNNTILTVNIIVTSALDAGGFITTEKKAHLSGIRVEADEPGDEGFVGYT